MIVFCTAEIAVKLLESDSIALCTAECQGLDDFEQIPENLLHEVH
jgi:hypothetical protein